MTTALPQEELSAIVTEVYDAFNARDVDGVLAHLAPGVDWPNGWQGGREHGRDAVRAYWEKQWREIDPRVEPMRIEVAPDGKVHVRVDQLVRDKSGKVLLNKQVGHVYTFDGPFITRMDIVDVQAEEDDDE